MRQIDQEIIEATDELKSDVALTTEIVTGNEKHRGGGRTREHGALAEENDRGLLPGNTAGH